MGRRQSVLFLSVGAVLLAALLLRALDPAPVARLRLAVFDSLLTSAPRVIDETFPVRIIDIDEASLAEFGQWPWPRTRLADLIDRLSAAGARTITLDLILAEPDRWNAANVAETFSSSPELASLREAVARLPSNDQLLAASISKAPVVLGFSADRFVERQLAEPRAPFAAAGDDPKLFVPAFDGGVGALPVFSQAAAGIGAVNWLPERDQVVRRVPLLINAAGKLYPSLALETIRIAQGPETTVMVRSSGASGALAFGQQTGVEAVRVGSIVLPSDGQGELWLKYAPTDARRAISARDVLTGKVPKSDIEGRFIFVGTSATGLMDLRTTPLAAAVPGVEIHAQALEQMLSGDHLQRPAWATGAELIFILLIGLLSAFLIARSAWAATYLRTSGPVAAAIVSLAAIVAVVAFSWAAYGKGLLIDPVYPSIALVAVYLVASLTSYVQSETDRARIRSAFGHYVSPSIIEELARSPGRLELGGETREITLLFADVRGFSRLSEGLDAQGLVRFVNTLFTPLADEILSHRGTIDKFMGDAVMAFWNAPLSDPDHARQACRAALAMQARLVELNGALERTEKPILLGIGLNTGDCVVGNVGSPQRFDYSVLGDVVNTASRIEEATKTYGFPIIVGEKTAAAAIGFAFVPIGATALRGKQRGEALFALIGDETISGETTCQELIHHVAAYSAAMAEGDGETAKRHIVAASAIAPAASKPILHAARDRLLAS